MNEKVIDALFKARERIKNPKNWIKGYYAKNASGHTVAPDSPNAAQWCSVGALESVVPEDYETRMAARRAVARAAGRSEAISFNDEPSTTHQDVIDAFTEAIIQEVAKG